MTLAVCVVRLLRTVGKNLQSLSLGVGNNAQGLRNCRHLRRILLVDMGAHTRAPGPCFVILIRVEQNELGQNDPKK